MISVCLSYMTISINDHIYVQQRHKLACTESLTSAIVVSYIPLYIYKPYLVSNVEDGFVFCDKGHFITKSKFHL